MDGLLRVHIFPPQPADTTMSRDFKRLDQLTEIDELHLLMAQVTGSRLDIGKLHQAVESVELRSEVPESIQG